MILPFVRCTGVTHALPCVHSTRQSALTPSAFAVSQESFQLVSRLLNFSHMRPSYTNTIPLAAQPDYPGDGEIERRLRSLVRCNAAAMVVRANRHFPSIGGHIATFASACTLFEAGFNYFFHARAEDHPGDFVYFQGHVLPGVDARTFLEGRINEEQLEHSRRETGAASGLSSYPHPWLMPEFFQFPTVSMGLSAMSANYQARYLPYLNARCIVDATKSHVWALVGNGDMDEPESVGGLMLATRKNLDNWTVVVTCNLQRLDGPVRGNGKILPDLESLFTGAGGNVVKVVSGWWDCVG